MSPDATVIRVRLPAHLRNLAQLADEVEVEVDGVPTVAAVLDELEERYPVLRGTIREHGSLNRRAFVRFFAGEEDISHEPQDQPLSDAVATGKQPLMVVGAMAGG